MSAPDLGTALLASLDEKTIRALAERLRPHLEDRPDHQPLLTPAQAAERLHLHPKTVVRMARDGRLSAVKVGTGWRFHADRLDIVLSSCSAVVEPPRAAARRQLAKREPASVRAIRGGRERGAA